MIDPNVINGNLAIITIKLKALTKALPPVQRHVYNEEFAKNREKLIEVFRPMLDDDSFKKFMAVLDS